MIHWKTVVNREIRRLEKLDQTVAVRAKLAHLRRRLVQNPGGKNQQRHKTHCPRNHPYSKKNTLVQKNGARVCRQCRRERYAEKVKQAKTGRKLRVVK
jgi:hypothetical protein